MDTINLQAINSASFVFTQPLSVWAQVYPLADGKFRSYMRSLTTDSIVLYEWSTDNGRITFNETAAVGLLTYQTNPVANDVINIGTTVLTFVASHTSGNNVVVASTLAGTLANLLAFLEASLDAEIKKCTYAVNGYELLITYGDTTLAGNTFPFSTTTNTTTVSGVMLAGAGGQVTMTAPVGDLEGFLGDYYYDVRLELGSSGSIIVQLFGGVITFVEGVTR